jgi:hypothetical protein
MGFLKLPFARIDKFLERAMRNILLVFVQLLIFCGSADAHSATETSWLLPDYDGQALLTCSTSAKTSDCDVLLYPCETAFGLSTGTELATLPEEARHDLTACFMALADLYEVALWNLEPGSDPDPVLSRQSNKMFDNTMFRHHRNAFGNCQSNQNEKTEDWRCASHEFQIRLIRAEEAR